MKQPKSILGGRDLVRLALSGLTIRPLRAALSALGIAVGVAAIVAVIGISTSARADLMNQLDALGTNLLQVSASQGLTSEEPVLPRTAADSARQVAPVEGASAVADVDGVVRRTDRVSEDDTRGIQVKAATPDLLEVLNGRLAAGGFLDDATGRYPVAVLGKVAAERLGVRPDGPTGVGTTTIRIGGQEFLVGGILDSLPLHADLERSVLVGYPVAEERLGLSGEPTTVYVRSDPDQVDAVRDVLAAQIDPQSPENVAVSRPSDALAAQAAADRTLTGLLLALSAVSLLVGGIGVANVMVVGVLERRGEIGLRRAIGATHGHIRRQFLAEAMVLAALGGVAGALIGVVVTVVYAVLHDTAVVVPPWALGAGVAVALVLGAIAGVFPAVRASRLTPVQALHTA